MSSKGKLFIHSSAVFPVYDVVKTANYYKDFLGFDISLIWGEPPYYSIVNREDAVGIHFTKIENDSIKIQMCMLYIFVRDVDMVYDEFKQKGLVNMTKPENQDYGMREFDLTDINGHRLTFGEGI